MSHPFKAVSLSFKKAPLAVRELLALDHPWIEQYFKGARGRAARQSVDLHSDNGA